MATFSSDQRLTINQTVDRYPNRFRHAAALVGLMVFSSCGDANAEVIAQASHNFHGDFKLFSYQAKPAEELGQAEALAKKTFGPVLSNIKSPSTMFMCVWRKIGVKRMEPGPPAELLLSCNFGPTPVKTPKSLLARAELFNTIDRAYLKASWKLTDEKYELTRFVVEIQSDKKRYRSQNLAADLPQIEVIQTDMKFPQNASEPFQFSLQSSLPRRTISEEPQREPTVSIAFSGVAEPIPSWVNYQPE